MHGYSLFGGWLAGWCNTTSPPLPWTIQSDLRAKEITVSLWRGLGGLKLGYWDEFLVFNESIEHFFICQEDVGIKANFYFDLLKTSKD